MVCRNEEQYAAIRWDDQFIYGFVAEPTKIQKNLVSAVNNLPIICRKVAILYAFEGVRREEITAILKISLAATRFLIHRSGLLLQGCLEIHKRQSFALGYSATKELCFDWPYAEYSKLVELRKQMVFLD